LPALQNLFFKQSVQHWERLIGVAAMLSVAIAWGIGAARFQADLFPYIKQAVPEAVRFAHLSGQTYAAYSDQKGECLLGYATIGTANGYGGPLTVAVAINPTGKIIGAVLVSNNETPSYLSRVLGNRGLSKLVGKSYSDPFRLGQDVDTVTGATYTTRALAESVAQASRGIAGTQLGYIVKNPLPTPIRFGLPEILLIALFSLGIIGRLVKGKPVKRIRWLTMIIGLIFLGFAFNQPLTISLINRFLLGFWPQWRTGLYWYLLAGGIFFSAAAFRRNPYCEWFCPFGAAQECLGAMCGAKVPATNRFQNVFLWLQRGVAWLAIVSAMILHNPGITSYEIFGALFGFVGSWWQFLLLSMVLLGALFIRRPWCRYLCPLRPVIDFVKMLGRWTMELGKAFRRQ
jgi:hypothetical protein